MAIDNGVTGWYAVVSRNADDEIVLEAFEHMPVMRTLDYRVKPEMVNRIDVLALLNIFTSFKGLVVAERPFYNPKFLRAMISSVRAAEALVIASELSKKPLTFVDSKAWQKPMLSPRKNDDLKALSLVVAKRLFPNDIPQGAPDGDAVCMGIWALRNYLSTGSIR